jgi:ribosomal protein S18 acetylase RimI-like enzyme
MMLQFKTAAIADIPLIRELTMMVWPQTYRSIISESQIEYMLEMMYSEASLTEQMTSKACEFVLVNDTERSLGFASYSHQEEGVFRLHKLYVITAAQGTGAGKALIHEVAKRVLEKKGDCIELNVNRHNSAVDFYKKIGFTIYREEDIHIGNDFYMNDYVMRWKLNH